MGIEAMFKDYKTGGYNLESAKANEIRLNNLILLILFHTRLALFKDKKLRTKGFKNIYQELMKKVEKKEDTVVFL